MAKHHFKLFTITLFVFLFFSFFVGERFQTLYGFLPLRFTDFSFSQDLLDVRGSEAEHIGESSMLPGTMRMLVIVPMVD